MILNVAFVLSLNFFFLGVSFVERSLSDSFCKSPEILRSDNRSVLDDFASGEYRKAIIDKLGGEVACLIPKHPHALSKARGKCGNIFADRAFFFLLSANGKLLKSFGQKRQLVLESGYLRLDFAFSLNPEFSPELANLPLDFAFGGHVIESALVLLEVFLGVPTLL